MTTVGIICECNPMHGGHEYLIAKAKEGRDVRVICVMSGCFVQRGEAAIADPYLRAEALIACGADAVLELPFPFSSASAEFFARAGVEIVSRLGIDELWFGSECGDLSLLKRAALISDGEEIARRYAETAFGNAGTAEAYLSLLGELCGGVSFSSNDILGIAYLRAIQNGNAQLRPVTVKREGSAYNESELSGGGFPSATALRKRWKEAGTEAILPLLPCACRSVYARAGMPHDLSHAERLILGYFRLAAPEQLEQIAELSGGLSNRLQNAARESQSLDVFLSLASTKKYPTARMRRGILFALTSVVAEDLQARIAYVRLLAATKEGCRALKELCKTADIDVVTRKADLKNTAEAKKQAAFEERAWDLYGLCRSDATLFPSPWQRSPVILE